MRFLIWIWLNIGRIGILRIIGKVKATALRELEFIGGEVDLRINIYRGQIRANGVKNGTDGVKLVEIDVLDQSKKLLEILIFPGCLFNCLWIIYIIYKFLQSFTPHIEKVQICML